MVATFKEHASLLVDRGIVLPGVTDYSYDPMAWKDSRHRIATDAARKLVMAMDAQAPLVSAPSSGIPAILNTMIQPEVIEVLTAKLKATEIASEEKRGDWTIDAIEFMLRESAGEVSGYGDYSANGTTTQNVNWVPRQAYYYQSITQWGEKQVAKMGLAKLDYVAGQNLASALVMNTFQNTSYFFGIQGIQNYGLLNDPSLFAPILPSTKVAGGTSWNKATPDEIVNDIAAIFQQLVIQTNELVDDQSPLKLCMSGISLSNFNRTNQFGLSAAKVVADIYPNLKIVTAPQYNTQAGFLLQLIVDEIEGQKTVITAFPEKFRSHAVIVAESSWRQKKSGGTWGAIIKFPPGIAQMLGI